MTEDAKLKEAREALLGMAQMCLAILKHSDPLIILAAADFLEAATKSPECKLAIEVLEARMNGLN